MSMKLSAMSKAQLEDFKAQVQKEYDGYKAQGLALNMARGKPSSEQLDLTKDMLTILKTSEDCFDADGNDCRNYGILDGINEAKELFAPVLGVSKNEIFVGGNSSLNMMYDLITKFMLFGTADVKKPWAKEEKVKWLCPCPGYDRHFLVTESLGFELIPVALNSDGPDMDEVERLAAEDPSIKGIWCVPMYSNPTGTVFSDEVVKRLANLKAKADDFTIIWDNAYCIHHLVKNPPKLLNILEECKKAGNPNRVFMFASTSKISFPGAGVAVMGASEENINYIKGFINAQTIGADKLNQLRHVRFFKDFEGLKAHMDKHMDIIVPRFKVVLDTLKEEIAPLEIADWTEPQGGYFISFNAPEGCAKRIVALCKEAGVVLTGAGATFPYGNDPKDSNIRIAPTYPPVEELKVAAKVFATAVKLAAAEKFLAE